MTDINDYTHFLNVCYNGGVTTTLMFKSSNEATSTLETILNAKKNGENHIESLNAGCYHYFYLTNIDSMHIAPYSVYDDIVYRKLWIERNFMFEIDKEIHIRHEAEKQPKPDDDFNKLFGDFVKMEANFDRKVNMLNKIVDLLTNVTNTITSRASYLESSSYDENIAILSNNLENIKEILKEIKSR